MLARISCSPTQRRSAGFTLVELLVVMLLILVLATLVVAFAPKLAERQKVPRGADLLQGWLLIAKQRAKRDQLPTGIRFQPDPDNPNLYRELQYIQKPDDLTIGQIIYNPIVLGKGPFILTLKAGTGSFLGGYKSTDDRSLWPVQPGDYVELKGGGLVHRITDVKASQLTLASDPRYPILTYPIITPTADYRIIRAPRPLVGEANLDLPKDIAVQGNILGPPAITYGSIPPQASSPPVPFDILFSPAGPVVGSAVSSNVPGVGSEAVIFWVRDATLDPSPLDESKSGEPLLVTVYVKTGLIAVHPVSPAPDYFTAVKDGRSSGL